MDQFRAKFIEEASELIATLEKALLALEHNAANKELVEQVFRVMHTLKGNSNMFGFEKMGAITHHLETIYDFIREGKREVSKDLVTLTFHSLDHFRHLLLDPDLSDEQARSRHERILTQIDQLIHPSSGKEPGLTPPALPSVENRDDNEKNAYKTYYIKFQPTADIFSNGTNPLYLLDELSTLGACQVVAHRNSVPSLEEINPALCYIHWEVYLATEAEANAIKDVFIFVEEECRLEIQLLAACHLLEQPDFVSYINQKACLQEEINFADLQHYVQGLSAKAIAQEPIKQTALPQVKQESTGSKEQGISSIRVSSDKLDSLMNLVSELVTTQARLSLFAEQNVLTELTAIAENVEKISRQLRDNTFSICLVPLESMLIRFQRLVRDLSSELGKDIMLVTEGADTELDKSIIESLADPLLHILRNSIDHGIEETALRIQKGKPKQGKILLKAYYSGTSVHIQIQDDGAGINPKKVREKAISKGLINPDIHLSEKQLLELIFLPGFSTAEKVTDVSGRGVGMDVVKRKIADLRGEVEISSQVDVGTSLLIKLPLTLSIIDGLLVKIAETHFVIPLALVDKCFECKHSELVDTFNNLITLDGEKVPFFYLRKEFEMEESDNALEQIIMVKYEEKKVGLTVDTIIGEYQAVLKPLGKLYKGQDMISGATILGDGTIALVMDTSKMIKHFSQTEAVTL